jgi:dGTPase
VELGRASREVATDGYYRTKFTSSLISNALDNIELVESPIHPALDQVRLQIEKFKEVEVLKSLNYATIINSSLMKTIEHQGKKVVGDLFEVLGTPSGSRLLTDDHKALYDHFPEPSMKKRVICDFIAGMTDRYALEFHERLVSTRPGSIYRPHN